MQPRARIRTACWRAGWRHALAGSALIALVGVATPLAAQSLTFLPAQHWARGALHRLAAAGDIDAAGAALSWPATRRQTLQWLDSATSGNSRAVGQPGNRAIERARFLRAVMTREEGAHSLHARMAVGMEAVTGALRAGTMEQQNNSYVYPGAARVPKLQSALLGAEVYAGFAEVGLAAQGTVRNGEAVLDAAYLSAGLGSVVVWAGRRSWTAGSVAFNNLVLNDALLDGAGLAVPLGLRVPLLGRVYPELLVARMQRSGNIEHPWFHAARITLAPAPALAIGLNRAAIFGGENQLGITPARVLLMLAGLPDVAGKDSDFENQVASFDFFWRTRLGNTPWALYGELGADDSGWAFAHVPGVIAGVEIAQLPKWPELALGVEVVHIARRCCNYPPWYQHGALADGWTDRGRLLGHPLGGAGHQAALSWRADVPAAGLISAGRFFLRERAGENLLAPLHQGRSAGAQVEAWLPWRRTQLQLRAEIEFGENSWQRSAFAVLGHVFF